MELERAAADNLKRVCRPGPVDDAAVGPERALFFTETKAVWHPIGV